MFSSINGRICLNVNGQIYSKDALLKSCYWLTDRCFVFIEPTEDGFAVHLTPKPDQAVELERVAMEFSNHLLDFELRSKLNAETNGIRQLIFAKAFAAGNLLEDVPPGGLDDPVSSKRAWDEIAT